MTDLNNLQSLETQVFAVNTKDYKTMMLAPDGMTLISKRVYSVLEFEQAVEKGGLLNVSKKVASEKLKSITVEKGEPKMTLNYRKLLELGAPGDLEFSSETVLEDVLQYMEKKWFFNRSEKPLTPLKAIVPYLLGLVATIYCTYFIIHTLLEGGSYRAPIYLIFLVKIGEKIGLLPTLLLGFIISLFVLRALWKAFKNPPMEIRLEPVL